jgi:tetraacyldisaccharide 4'-kinase
MRWSPAVRAVLWPAALLWDAAARLRAGAYRTGLARAKRLPGTVISVGNLTTGGTGKTPMVLWIVERLRHEGRRVAVLTRGYRGPRASTRQTATQPESDEVAVLRARLPRDLLLGVGPNRLAQGMALARQGADCFVLDDGFQHLRLARDVDVVLLDATDPFGGNRALPVGRLREPKAALRRAHVIVITRSDHTPALEAMVKRYSSAPIFYARTRLLEVVALPDGTPGTATSSPERWPRRVFAFCGVGNPRAFFDDLTRWGFELAGCAAFPDHHTYSPTGARRLEAQARAVGSEALLCTEKDVFNLRRVHFASLPVYFLRISLEPADPEGLWRAILEVLAQRRGAKAA